MKYLIVRSVYLSVHRLLSRLVNKTWQINGFCMRANMTDQPSIFSGNKPFRERERERERDRERASGFPDL